MKSTFVICAALLVAASALPAEDRFFWMTDGEGKMQLVDTLLEEPEPAAFNGDKDVTFYLYTRSNTLLSQTLKPGDTSSGSNFNPNHPTRFVIHGWVSSATTLRAVRTAYTGSGKDFNTIMVDWSGVAASLYTTAKSRTVDVGEYLAASIQTFVRTRGLNLDNTFIIGHSLGAHISGIAGNRLGSAVAQVVGLDPALPLFLTTSSRNKLDASDAKYVQVIHTDGGGLGFSSSLGDVDFHPNGGSSQSGCALDLTGVCDHNRAYAYYAESINSARFVSRKCSSYTSYRLGLCITNASAVMGEQVATSATGDYYLDTRAISPYAQG